MQLALGLALSALSACLFFLSLPPFNHGYLAWFALVPMIFAQFKLTQSNFAASAFLYVAFFIAGGASMFHSVPKMDLGFGDLRYLVVAAVGLMALFVLITGLPSGTRRFHEKTQYRYFVLLPICCWVGFEYFRYALELGQMWCMFFISQHQNLLIVQLSSLLGIWLITAIVIAVNYLLALAAIRLYEGDTGAFTKSAGLAVAVFVLSHLSGWLLLQQDLEQSGSIKIAAIQKGSSFEASRSYYSRNRLILTEEMLDAHEKLTLEAAKQKPDLVVWPESVVWVNPHKHDAIMRRLKALAAKNRFYLIVAYIDEYDKRGTVNEAMVFSPNGEYLGASAKDHPIILPNYIDGSATRGDYPTFDIAGAKTGILIGYDVDFTDTAAKLVNNGAQLLAIPMHDRPSFWQNQFLHTVFRAAENRVSIVRADWRHASTMIDPFGRIVAQPLKHNEPTAVIYELPLYASGSLYTHLGDVLAYACFLAMLFFFAYHVRLRCLPLSRSRARE